ncbi:MAG: immunity 53 family protein [Synechococcus sp.]
MSEISVLSQLQAWYLGHCNDDWEHFYGVSIGTLDNPGWSLHIDLLETELVDKEFSKLLVQRESKDDWLSAEVEKQKFCGFCGPENLEELLTIFLDWAEE